MEYGLYLSTLIWLPIIGGLSVLALGRLEQVAYAKLTALLIAVASLVICGLVATQVDFSNPALQITEKYPWLPEVGIYYHLALDGFSFPLILLTCVLTPFIIVMAWHHTGQVSSYLAAFLVLQGLMCGVFLAIDVILFYVFWEASLIPMFFLVGLWGGSNRIYATLKFFLYTFFGSIFLLATLLFLHYRALEVFDIAQSFSLDTFKQLDLSLATQKIVFWGLFIGFAVKIPMWPIHTWLPDAHVEAPTEGSAILAAIMLKMGGYGMIRFLLPTVPEACHFFANSIIYLSLIAIVYIGLVALVQQDMKKLIAYSSIAHMGFVTLGLFVGVQSAPYQATTVAEMALQGAFIQMISHGIISAGLFFSIGILYQRTHSRAIKDYGGVTQKMPTFAAFVMILALANAGVPATSGFVGEFLVIVSSFTLNPVWAMLAASTLVLGAGYTLWMIKRVFFGPVHPKMAALTDILPIEKMVLAALVGLILLLGIYPKPFNTMLSASTKHLIQQLKV